MRDRLQTEAQHPSVWPAYRVERLCCRMHGKTSQPDAFGTGSLTSIAGRVESTRNARDLAEVADMEDMDRACVSRMVNLTTFCLRT